MANPFDKFDEAPRADKYPSVQWRQHYRLLKADIVLAVVPRLLSLLPKQRQSSP